jgi:hypothetical protein
MTVVALRADSGRGQAGARQRDTDAVFTFGFPLVPLREALPPIREYYAGCDQNGSSAFAQEIGRR